VVTACECPHFNDSPTSPAIAVCLPGLAPARSLRVVDNRSQAHSSPLASAVTRVGHLIAAAALATTAVAAIAAATTTTAVAAAAATAAGAVAVTAAVATATEGSKAAAAATAEAVAATTTATVPTTATATTVATTAAAATLTAGVGEGHAQGAAAHVLAVHGVCGGNKGKGKGGLMVASPSSHPLGSAAPLTASSGRGGHVGEAHEAEALAAARLAVGDHLEREEPEGGGGGGATW
jgi:hypothetical protein